MMVENQQWILNRDKCFGENANIFNKRLWSLSGLTLRSCILCKRISVRFHEPQSWWKQCSGSGQCIVMVNSDDDVDGDGGDDDDQEEEEKYDEESSLRMIILVSSRTRENNIHGRLRGVLLPPCPSSSQGLARKCITFSFFTIITQSTNCYWPKKIASSRQHQWMIVRLQTIFELVNIVENGK